MKSEYYWTWRKGRELLQFDSEETMNNFRPPNPESWWRPIKGGPQLYAFLAPKLPNVDFIRRDAVQNPMKANSKPKFETVLGTLGSSTSIPAEVKKTYNDYNSGKIDRKKFREELERLMWKSKMNAPEYFSGLKKITDWLRQKDENPNQGTIKLKDEGYGAVYTKDIKKDPKHTTNKYTGKVNRWTVKFCESLDGSAAQTPSDEESIRKLIDKLKINTAIVFYSLTNPKIGIYIRRTGTGELEITDTAGAEYRLHIPEDESKLDLLTYQLSKLHRKYNTHKTFQTISSKPFVTPPKRIKREELKEVVKELIQEMWMGWEQEEHQHEAKSLIPQQPHATIPSEEEIQVINLLNKIAKMRFGKNFDELDPEVQAKFFKQFEKVIDAYMKEEKHPLDKYLDGDESDEDLTKEYNGPKGVNVYEEENDYKKWVDSYLGEKCPKCGTRYPSNTKVLKGLNPNYQCPKCDHKWNSDNEISTMKKVGNKSIKERDLQFQKAYPSDTWKPKKFTKTPEEVSTLIFRLNEGEGITFFMSDKQQGRSTDWIAIEKTVEGDEYVYKYFQYKDQGAKYYLESDEDILDLATKIAENPKFALYEFYEVNRPDGQTYRKQPRDLYEAKGMTNKEKLRSIIREAIEEIEHDYNEETEKQLINSIATISRTSLSKISSLRPEEIEKAFKEIDRMAEKLVNMHKEPGESPFAMYREEK